MSEGNTETAPSAALPPVAPIRPRWFRRWWIIVPLMVAVVALGQFNVALAAVPFVVLMLLYWTGPVPQAGKVGKPVSTTSKAFITIAFVAFLAFQAVSQADRLERVTEIPKCDSRYAEQLFAEVVKNSPAGRTRGLELVGLKDTQEAGWDSSRQVRLCHTNAFFNSGPETRLFEMTWWDRAKGQVLLEVKP